MPRTRFENLRVYILSEELADAVWSIVIKWDRFACNTVGMQLTRAADSVGANIAEGIFADAVYVIADQHQAARLHLGAQAARRICQDQVLDPHLPKYPDRKGHALHVVAFVKMETSGLDGDARSVEFAKYQLTRVSFNR